MSASGDGAGFSSDHLFSRTLGRLLKIEKGEGIYLWDILGKRYIDGSSGPVCVNIGHGVKEIKEAVAEQMKNVSYVYSSHFVTESVLKCAEKISSFSPDNMEKTYFCSGGSEATEAAAKLSRQYHLERGEDTRYKVIARWQSYHGNTLGALSMSGNIIRRKKYVPMLLDFPHIPPAYCYRCPFKKTKESCDLDCAHALEWEIKANGAEYVSAFIAEPVVGATLGTLPAPPGYFQIIRDICDKYGVLFIADEVMTGLGRTGKNWGIQHWDVIPDIITAAKGLSGGYMPLGACIVHDKVSDAFTNPFAHGHTYGSHPVACAVGIAVLEYVEKHKLVDRSAKLGAYFHDRLQEFYQHPTVGDIRGIGLFAGIEFVIDKDSKKPFHPSVAFYRRVVDRCAKNGLLVYPGMATVDGVVGDHIQVAPPLVIKKDQIDEILDILDRSLYDVEGDVL